MNICFFFKGRFTNDKHTKILVYDFYDQEKNLLNQEIYEMKLTPGRILMLCVAFCAARESLRLK